MSIEIIQQRLEAYGSKTVQEENHALKEITQEIALLALSKANFFKVAEFHGGTALRILYGLQRFSEDLDFALLKPKTNFDLNTFLGIMREEFSFYGYEVEVTDRDQVDKIVQKQFLKVDSIGKELTLNYPFNPSTKKIKIKFEVDTNPPLGATTEIKYLTFPIPFSVLAKDLPSSFAGKMHALLCRSHIKGRDWYDFIWYVSRNVTVNYNLLTNALHQQGPWKDQRITADKDWLIHALSNRIQSISWPEVRQDVAALLRSHELPSLEIWNKDFFMQLLNKFEAYSE